jgi:hypothetical protein
VLQAPYLGAPIPIRRLEADLGLIRYLVDLRHKEMAQHVVEMVNHRLIISAQHGQGFVDELDGTAQGIGALLLLLRQRPTQDL